MNNKGQTTIEYILLMTVMIFVGIAFFNQLNSYLVTNPDSLIGRIQSSFDELITSGSNEPGSQYKSFTIRR